MQESFTIDPDLGALFAINGIDTPIRWDGLNPSFGPIGLDPPANAITLTGAAAGPIVGTYWAYLRFVDNDNNVSDLSPISAQFSAAGTTGAVTGATNTSPIVITSAGHGLPTGAFVNVSGVGGNTSANTTTTITAIDANTFSLDNSHGTADYDGGGTWISGIAVIVYSNVQVPLESKVARRQILRNTDGQASTFYVDVDTTDLTGTTFASVLTDSLLQANESVPLLDANQLPFANSNAKPLDYFKAIGQQLDRMFACGIIDYTVGSVSVTFGSTLVQGAGTGWVSTLATRFLYVEGAGRIYVVQSVDPVGQTLTLTQPYADSTNLFAFYSIKPPPAYRRVVAFSQAGKSQSWPAFNGLSIQETNDEIVGPMSMGSFVFIVEKAHIHKLTFSAGPLIDGGVYLVSARGCVNARSWIVVDNSAYMLDELGVHKFDLNARSEPISGQIATMFREDKEAVDANINWRWKENFHAMLDRPREIMRWFVCLDGSRYPRHALAYQHRLGRWWIEEYPFPIGGSCSGYIGGFNGKPQVYYGGQHGKVFAAWSGCLDVANNNLGSVGGLCSSASSFTLTDSASSFAQALNAPVAIVLGTGKGQVRRIVGVNGQTLAIDRPWSVLPDQTSQYQIGGIKWLYRASWIRLTPSETMMQRRFEMLFEPVSNPVKANLRFFTDFSPVADVQMADQKSGAGGGIATMRDDPDLVVDLTKETGLVMRDQPGGKDMGIQGATYRQFELDGFSNLDQIKLYQMLWAGFLPPDGGGQ